MGFREKIIRFGEGTPPPKWSQQSPIDLREPTYYVEGLRRRLAFRYPSTPILVEVQNDHELHVLPGSNARVLFRGIPCPLLKIHFHRTSEHQVNGKRQYMEVHLVHEIPPEAKMPSKNIVVAVFVDKHPGTDVLHSMSEASGSLIHQLHKRKSPWATTIDLHDLLPPTSLDGKWDFWHYEGSLTTPPFSEDVSWVVLHEHRILHEKTTVRDAQYTTKPAREAQPLNRRFVLRSFKV